MALKMGPIIRPHYTLRNIPERRYWQVALINFQDSGLANERNISVVYKSDHALLPTVLNFWGMSVYR
jgi:hypothetical protein